MVRVWLVNNADRFMTTPVKWKTYRRERTSIVKCFKCKIQNQHVSVKLKGHKRVVFSSDVGGQERFESLDYDMVNHVEAVVYMFDDRAFKGGNDALQQIAGFTLLMLSLTGVSLSQLESTTQRQEVYA